MTYEEFYNTADQHINEVVRFTVLFKATGDTMTIERVNYDGKNGWVEKESPDALIQTLNCEWTGKTMQPVMLSSIMQ